jgi:ABC-type antimicrobial peptide transport system permease subunit
MKVQKPPKLARKIFEWYCGQAQVDDLLGDMEESFFRNIKSKSGLVAKWIYWMQMASLIFSYGIKKRKRDSRYSQFATNDISVGILRNYLVVSARTLYRHKYFTVVNAVGLALGMSVSLFLITMLAFINTYDNFHVHKSGIYRITTRYKSSGREFMMAMAPAALAEKLRIGFTGIDGTTRIATSFFGDVKMASGSVPIRGYYADPEFLSIFSFEIVQGNRSEALRKPNSVVITESTAKKLFGNEVALGKIIEITGQGSLTITGVLKDPPSNSHLSFESLVSYNSLPLQDGAVIRYDGPFTYKDDYVYFLTNDSERLGKLEDYLDKLSREASRNSQAEIKYEIQALTDITPGKYLSMITAGLGPQWDIDRFYFFGTICLLILLPACFNYTNISIARAIRRAKEIGLRKTMGGQRGHIFLQFITETVLVTIVSLCGALFLFFLGRQEFQRTLVAASDLDLSLTWTIAGLFLAFAILTGLVAGAAPSLYFARLNPIQALKTQSSKTLFSGMWMRKGLTIFQFILSFGFIVSLIVFSRQYRYSMNYDFGFQRENILDITLQKAKPGLVAAEYAKLSSVKDVSFSSDIMGLHHSAGDSWMQYENQSDSIRVNEMFVDPHYIENLGLKFLSGKNFPDLPWTHEKHLIVNEQYLKLVGIPDARGAIGKVVRVDKHDLEIIGVLKDFHFSSLRDPIKSFAFRTNPANYQYANLKVSFADVFSNINEMEKVWKKLGQITVFQAKFMSDEIRGAYEFYNVIMKIFGFLGILAISISLLGMLGMVVYTSETRTKEVGIRKVLGASVTGITLLLSKDYLKLMGWAFLIAIPLAYVIIDWMLTSAQYYSVRLNIWDILAGMVILITLGLLTISGQTVRIATTNPAETLKVD